MTKPMKMRKSRENLIRNDFLLFSWQVRYSGISRDPLLRFSFPSPFLLPLGSYCWPVVHLGGSRRIFTARGTTDIALQVASKTESFLLRWKLCSRFFLIIKMLNCFHMVSKFLHWNIFCIHEISNFLNLKSRVSI